MPWSSLSVSDRRPAAAGLLAEQPAGRGTTTATDSCATGTVSRVFGAGVAAGCSMLVVCVALGGSSVPTNALLSAKPVVANLPGSYSDSREPSAPHDFMPAPLPSGGRCTPPAVEP